MLKAYAAAALAVLLLISPPIVAALAIHLFIGTTTALAAEAENAGRTVQPEAGLNRGLRPAASSSQGGTVGFTYPASTANRRFVDPTGKIQTDIR